MFKPSKPPSSGGGGPVDAYDVTYDHDPFTNVGEALDFLLYVAPAITSFTGGSVNEIGSSVADVDLNWTLNKDVTTQTLTGPGSIDPALRTYHFDGPWTTNQSWTLTVGDGENTANATQSVLFRNKRYWGASADPGPLSDADIIAFSQEFATGFNKSISYDCSGGKYPYYAYPESFGDPTHVTVGGLDFSAYTIEVQSFTNASGHTSDYNVIRFDTIQFGASINVVWA